LFFEDSVCILTEGSQGGTIRRFEDIPEGDFRRYDPRLQPDTLPKNIALVDAVTEVAKRKNVTASQVGLAWVKAFNDSKIYAGNKLTIIPIPGTTSEERIKENTADISLTKEEFEELGGILGKFKVEGNRYGGPLNNLSDQ
jgi:pyridoxine 4-dehydrogenase